MDSRIGDWLGTARTVAEKVALVCFGALTVGFVVLGIQGIQEPKDGQYLVWGTYTETSCDPVFLRSCDSYGTWTSDDGALVKDGIGLNGDIEVNGTVRAAFETDGSIDDDDNIFVDTVEHAGVSDAGSLFVAAGVVAAAGVWFWYAFSIDLY